MAVLESLPLEVFTEHADVVLGDTSGLGTAGGIIGPDDLRGIFQPTVILWSRGRMMSPSLGFPKQSLRHQIYKSKQFNRAVHR